MTINIITGLVLTALAITYAGLCFGAGFKVSKWLGGGGLGFMGYMVTALTLLSFPFWFFAFSS